MGDSHNKANNMDQEHWGNPNGVPVDMETCLAYLPCTNFKIMCILG